MDPAGLRGDAEQFVRAFATMLSEERDKLVECWLAEIGEHRLRPRTHFPVDELRGSMPEVVGWLALSLTDGAAEPVEVNTFKEIARLRRRRSYKIAEVLEELDGFDRLLFQRMHALLRNRFADLGPGDALHAAERLRASLERLRTVFVGTYEEEAERYAAELSDRLDSFVRTLSHELKNPLGAALSAAELLADPAFRTDAAQAEKFTRLALRNLKRIDALIEDLRTLALKAAPATEAPSVSLAEVAHDVLAEVQTAAYRKQVRLEVDEDAIPDRAVDGARLTLVLMNLVWNAINYSDPGKSERWVRMEMSLDGDSALRISVADNGLGIPPDARDRIFERFFRAHPDVQGGTGLGLSIVAEAVAEMKGTVSLESTAGEGTRFVVTLPAAADPG